MSDSFLSENEFHDPTLADRFPEANSVRFETKVNHAKLWLIHSENLVPPREPVTGSRANMFQQEELNLSLAFSMLGFLDRMRIACERDYYRWYQIKDGCGDKIGAYYMLYETMYTFPYFPQAYLALFDLYNSNHKTAAALEIMDAGIKLFSSPPTEDKGRRITYFLYKFRELRASIINREISTLDIEKSEMPVHSTNCTDSPKSVTITGLLENTRHLNSKDQNSPTDKRVDFFAVLPEELLVQIILILPLKSRLNLLLVCKTWNRTALAIPRVWQAIDFADTSRPIRLREFQKCLSLASGILNSVRISNILMVDTRPVIDLVFQAISHHSGTIRVLEIECSAPLKTISNFFYQIDSAALANLVRLRLSYDTSFVFQHRLLFSGQLTNLQELTFHISYIDDQSHFTSSLTDCTVFERPPELILSLKFFHIGSEILESGGKNYHRTSGRGSSIDSDYITNFLALAPNVDILQVSGINLHDRNLMVSENRLNLSASKLRKVCLVEVEFSCIPLLPVTCTELYIIDSRYIKLPWRESSTEQRVLYSSGSKLLSSESKYNEFQSLRRLELGGMQETSAVRFVAFLSLLNGEKMEDLSLYGLRFPGCFSSIVEFNPSMWTTVSERLSLAQHIVQLLPNLERLDLRKLIVDDESLLEFHKLGRLKFFDLSGTSITSRGIWALLTGEWVPALARSMFQIEAAPWDVKCKESQIEAIILKKCRDVPKHVVEMLEKNGIRTGLDKPELPGWKHLKVHLNTLYTENI
ncbi:uncharacterized protein V1516DRAFT_693707 [Lipomyces oligophaga]|uniref:uncharacterized protein n=1 Tax=Lipomyces oligophaga TaxID=45792 RepID=UPI0034CFAA19